VREAALFEPGHDGREIDLAGPRRHVHVPGVQVILDRHAHHETVDGCGILNRVKPAVGIVVDVARIVPEAEMAVPDEFDHFAALRTGGVPAAVRFDAQADFLLGGIITTGGDDPVVVVVMFRVADAGKHQSGRTDDCAGVDHSSQSLGRRVWVGREEIARIDVRDLQSTFFDFLADAEGLIGCCCG